MRHYGGMQGWAHIDVESAARTGPWRLMPMELRSCNGLQGGLHNTTFRWQDSTCMTIAAAAAVVALQGTKDREARGA